MANVGTPDRIIRSVAGVVLIVLAFIFAGSLGTLAAIVIGVVGLVLIGTAAFSFCPIYAALGISSKRRSQ